jgi:hypothetical protein
MGILGNLLGRTNPQVQPGRDRVPPESTRPREGRTDVARAKRADQPVASLTLSLVPRDWDKPDPEGDDDIWGRGFMLHDERALAGGGTIPLWRDATS